MENSLSKEDHKNNVSSSQHRPLGVCGWINAELRSVPSFGVVDANGKTIDLNQSFCLGDNNKIIAIKFALWGLTISTLVWGWITYEYPHWFLAYVSYWTLVYTCVYMSFSLFATIRKSPPLWTVRATWVLYTVAIVHNLLVVLLFWIFEYDPERHDLDYFRIMSHGGTFVLCLVDGQVVNRVPIRLKHYGILLIFGLLFIAWTLMQAFTPIDNPWKDEEDDSESLYSLLDWVNQPGQAALISFLSYFCAAPLFLLMFWRLSLVGRRYLEEDEQGRTAHVNDEEGESDVETGGAVDDGRTPTNDVASSSDEQSC